MPDFWQLAAGMWAQLNNDSTSNVPAGMDPIDVASEFDGIFFRTALNEFVRRSLVDAAYAPGRIHRLLLSLPWADVFTTNYDTLLERAARDVNDRQYSIVCTSEGIIGSQRPRIVKLHGTLPDRLPFIITKEDFRRYPQTHPAFVNTVQQAVMECSLCLLGFAGNDPNFLAWSGWVRDHLGPAAPVIYLAGVLDLDVRKRTLLDHRHVVPIDLGGLFPRSQWSDPQLRHRAANEWLLLYLAVGDPDPMTWPSLQRRSASAAWHPEPGLPPILAPADVSPKSDLPALLNALAAYPGWLTCPPSVRWHLEMLLRRDWKELKAALESSDRKTAEPAWLAFMRATELLRGNQSADNLGELRALLDKWADASEAWFELARSYLAQLRYAERWDDHAKWLAQLQEKAGSSMVRVAKLRWEQALTGLSRLDRTRVRDAVKDWPILPEAYQLELARAAVLAELGEPKEAGAIVSTVLNSLRRLAGPVQGALQTLALEGIAMTFAQVAMMDLPRTHTRMGPYGRYRELARWDCEPDEYFEDASHTLRKVPPEQFRVVKSFDVGSYSIASSFTSTGDEHKKQAVAALRLFEALSLPFRCGNSTYHVDVAIGAAKVLASDSPATAFSTFVRAHQDLDATFGALFVARLTEEQLRDLNEMAARFVHDSNDGLGQDGSFDRYSLAIVFELRSRLLARLPADEVDAAVDDAFTWAERDELLDDIVIAGSVRHCIVRGLEAMPRDRRELLVGRLLALPLPLAGRLAVGTSSWADPLQDPCIPKRVAPAVQAQWERQIEALLVTAKMAEPEESWAAITRLAGLHGTDNLTESQAARLGDAIWAHTSTDAFSVYSRWYGFFPTLLLVLPGTVPRDGAALRASLIAKEFPSSDGNLGSARYSAEKDARFHFKAVASLLESTAPVSQSEASQLLLRAHTWLEIHLAREPDPLGATRGEVTGDTAATALVELLEEHVLPAISPPEAADVATLAAIRRDLEGTPLPLLLEHHFQRFGLSELADSVTRLMQATRSKNDLRVTTGVDGIIAWLTAVADPPGQLLDALVELLRRPGPRSFPIVLRRLANFVHGSPSKLPSTTAAQLATILKGLLEETDLTKEENDHLFADPSWMSDARYSAACLAAELWKHFPSLRGDLASWPPALRNDPVVRARAIWLDVTGDDPAGG
jgi:hypothetical protein